jgi:hypothetical protein
MGDTCHYIYKPTESTTLRVSLIVNCGLWMVSSPQMNLVVRGINRWLGYTLGGVAYVGALYLLLNLAVNIKLPKN